MSQKKKIVQRNSKKEVKVHCQSPSLLEPPTIRQIKLNTAKPLKANKVSRDNFEYDSDEDIFEELGVAGLVVPASTKIDKKDE